MTKFLSLPTWLIATVVVKFKKHHPWSDNGRMTYTLTQWRLGQTFLCKQFDLLFWFGGFVLVWGTWMLSMSGG